LGVFVDRHFGSLKRVLLLAKDASDREVLLPLARHLSKAHNASIAILPLSLGENAPALDLGPVPEEANLLTSGDGVGVLRGYDFLFISYDTWGLLTEVRPEILQELPSTLIVRALERNADPLAIPATKNMFE